MDLSLDKHSPLPPHAQIQEKIKLALLLGRLRPGDTLPSIREVEKETGISRNVVRKAYLELQNLGILDLRHGKGVLVQKQLCYGGRDSVNEKCEAFAQEILGRLRDLSVSPSAFARYLYQQARDLELRSPFMIFVDATKSLATERASNISAIWQVNVPGYSIDDLASMPASELAKIRKVLTNYMRFDQVRRIVADHAEVIPLGLTFAEKTVKELGSLPAKSSLILVLDDKDYPSLSLLIDLYRKIVVKPETKISALPFSKIKDLQSFVTSAKYDKIIFSNRVWNRIPGDLKEKPKVTRPYMEVDLSSLESARIYAGVVI